MVDLILHLNPVILATVVALILFLAIVPFLLFSSIYSARAKFERRISGLIENNSERPQSGRQDEQRTKNRRRGVETRLREAERLKSRKKGYRLHEELVQAGLAISPRHFIFCVIFLGILLSTAYLVSGLPKIGLPLIAIVGLLGLPKLFLRFRVKRRLKNFTVLLADSIDIIVRGVRTGLTVGECLAVVGREMPDPVGVEFRTVTEGIQLGLTLEACMNRMITHVPTTEVRFLSIVLVMQQATGGNLAETLAKLSDIIRARKRMRDKIQAFSSEAKASATIVGSLPILVGVAISILAPDYIRILFTSDTGHLIIAGGLLWMAVGIFVMNKMIKFDY